MSKKKKKVIEFSSEQFKSFILTKKHDKFVNALNANYDKIVVDDYLYLSNTQITSLPDNLYVEGDLDLQETPITSLPDNLYVGGSLILVNTKIKSLSDNLKVKEFIYIYGTPLNDNDELINEYEAKGYKFDRTK